MSFRVTQRKEQILEELILHAGYLTSQYLSQKLKVSARTIREDIHQLTAQLEEQGIELAAVPSRGYSLQQDDYDKAAAYLDSLRQAPDDVPSLPVDRLRYILQTLLFDQNAVHLDDLADALCVSRSTVDKDISEAREWLAAHDLTLISRKSHGLVIQGSEMAVRYAMLDFFGSFYDLPDLSDLIFIQEILGGQLIAPLKEIISDLQTKEDLVLSDADFLNLLIYLAVSVFRISKGNVIEETEMAYFPDPSNKTRSLAITIADQVEAIFNIQFSPAEITNLNGCLPQMNASANTARKATDNQQGKQVTALIAEALWEIRVRFNQDFSCDEALTCGLAIYLESLVNRREFGNFNRKAGLEGIIHEYPDALEMAVTVSAKLKAELGVTTSEEEIGNIALYFCAAIERGKESGISPKKKVVIICATGSAGSQLLAVKIRRGFPELHIAGIYPTYRLQEALAQKPELVLSTIPLKGLSCPVVQISHLVGNEDQVRIHTAIEAMETNEAEVDLTGLFHPELFFTGLSAKDKDAAIRSLCEQINQQGFAGGDFVQAVLARESIFPTDIGNLVAIPHAIGTNVRQSWIAVGILDQPLQWGSDPAQLILLLNIAASAGEEFKRIYEELYRKVNQKKTVEQLIQSKNFNEFMKVMHA